MAQHDCPRLSRQDEGNLCLCQTLTSLSDDRGPSTNFSDADEEAGAYDSLRVNQSEQPLHVSPQHTVGKLSSNISLEQPPLHVLPEHTDGKQPLANAFDASLRVKFLEQTLHVSPEHVDGKQPLQIFSTNGSNASLRVNLLEQPVHVSPEHTDGKQPLKIFSEQVWLPVGSAICNSIGKLVEVSVGGHLSDKDLQSLQKDHPELLIDWGDKTLCFQKPSSSATDLASVFDKQICSYLSRHGKRGQIGIGPSSSLFRAPGRQYRSKICADLTLFELTGYEQKVNVALASGSTIPRDVQVFATVEVQNYSQTEEQIRDACRKEANLIGCISVAIYVKTGSVEILGPGATMLFQAYNPLYIDVGQYCRELRGLRLYMDPLRHRQGWPYPQHPNSYVHEEATHRTLPSLIAAINGDNFPLAENILNYMQELDESPLVEAIKKAIQGVPHAFAFVTYLLENGARPTQGSGCISAMLVASAAHDQAIVSLLRQYGAPPLDLGPDVVVAAVQQQHLKLLALLRDAGADFNSLDSSGRSALSMAIDMGWIPTVQLLIDAGCVPTPEMLLFAIRRGRENVISILIKGGADPNQLTSDGRLPLVEAVRVVSLVEAIANAAQHVDIEKKDSRGVSALSYAKKSHF